MNYLDSRSSFMPPPLPLYAGSDAIGIWPDFSMNEGQFDPHSQFEGQQYHQSPFKRLRHSEESQSDSVQCMPVNSRLAVNPPVNKGTSNIFFKTRMCAKFRAGVCRNGENCNFAHGVEDLRQPPPNWQELVGGGGRDEERSSESWNDDQKIIHRMKLCKKFYNGEECPYGDGCNFLHENPSKFRDDMGRFRESSAISIGTTGTPMGNGSGYNQSDGNRPMNNNNNTVQDAFRSSVKPIYWKTKLCTKWETTGQCPFGDKCHFAHGQAELQVLGGRMNGDQGSTGSSLARAGPISTIPHSVPVNDASPVNTVNVPTSNEEGQSKICFFKWKGPRKINKIYGDWLEDMPLMPNLPSQVES